jgi:hypothetical protein
MRLGMITKHYDCPHEKTCGYHEAALESNVVCPKSIEVRIEAGSSEITYRCIPLDITDKRGTVLSTDTEPEVDCDYLGSFADLYVI